MRYCDVCGEKMHTTEIKGKIVPVRCPLEPYKDHRLHLSAEMKFFNTSSGVPFGNTREELERLARIVPDESVLEGLHKKSAILKGSLFDFHVNFIRFLIYTYQYNTVKFVDATQEAERGQYNYLYLTPDILKDAHFNNGERFKNISSLSKPKLLIYRLGSVSSVYMKEKGNMVKELLQNRLSLGKTTWLLLTTPMDQCDEISTSEEFRLMLSTGLMPTYRLNDEEPDIEVFAQNVIETPKSKRIKIEQGKYNYF